MSSSDPSMSQAGPEGRASGVLAHGVEPAPAPGMAPEPAPAAPAAPNAVDGTHADARPRPAYGEYATAEQQRAAIRQPAASPPPPVRATRPPAGGSFAPMRPVHATTSAARPSRRADRAITFALLAYGLFTVVTAVPQLWHYADFAQTWMNLAGIEGTFSNTAQGDLWGRIGAATFVVGWLVTAAVSWRVVSRGHLGWWIPLVGAIVTFLVASVCLSVPLLSDPVIVSHFAR